MLSVIISFLYIGITSFLIGFGVCLLVKRFLKYEIKEVSAIVMAGLGSVTVYAGFVSLTGPVGGEANALLCLLCLGVFFVGRKELTDFLEEKRQAFLAGDRPVRRILLWVLLVLIMAYGCSRGYQHFDTGLYHAQSIRWIEEYGVVPGLANLHSRLGYNSSSFVLTALYSGAFLTGRSLHTAAGFLALVLAGKGFAFRGLWREKRILPSDFVRIALLWYLSIIYTEMVSPASDYFAMLFLFYILLTWIELTEKEEKNSVPYCLLCVLLCVAVTIKLSVGVLLLLVVKPAFHLLRSRNWKQILLYLGLGLFAALPWMARNVILSGWLVYPLDAIDLFSFDWKIPVGELQYDAEEIRVYAKGMTDVLKKDTPLLQWLPGWFGKLKSLEKLWVIGSAVSVPAGLVWSAVAWYRRKKETADLILVELALIAGYLVWQIGSPLVRYGYLFILAFPFFTAGLWIRELFGERGRIYRLVVIGVVLLAIYKSVGLAGNMWKYWQLDCYLWQQDYTAGDWDTYELGGEIIYVPLDAGQIGYYRFPSSPYVREDVELRGSTLKEGFRRIQPDSR